MYSICRLIKGLKSVLVGSLDAPYLGASPDGKVVDIGCSVPEISGNTPGGLL